eukprot:3200282-Rhodomonas_salina.3
MRFPNVSNTRHAGCGLSRPPASAAYVSVFAPLPPYIVKASAYRNGMREYGGRSRRGAVPYLQYWERGLVARHVEVEGDVAVSTRIPYAFVTTNVALCTKSASGSPQYAPSGPTHRVCVCECVCVCHMCVCMCNPRVRRVSVRVTDLGSDNTRRQYRASQSHTRRGPE